MHDKYAYERLEMALHDRTVLRTMACGIAGLSVAADSLSAIRYATVKPVRDERGLIVDYLTEGTFPTYGNDDDRVDSIAVELVREMMRNLRRQPDLPQRGTHPVGADDHLERRLRQGHRQHAGRPPRRAAVRTRGQPDERPRLARDVRQRAERVQAALLGFPGRDLAHLDGGALRAGPRPRRADRQPGRAARRVRGLRRASTSTSTCSTARPWRTRWSTRRSTRS